MGCTWNLSVSPSLCSSCKGHAAILRRKLILKEHLGLEEYSKTVQNQQPGKCNMEQVAERERDNHTQNVNLYPFVTENCIQELTVCCKACNSKIQEAQVLVMTPLLQLRNKSPDIDRARSCLADAAQKASSRDQMGKDSTVRNWANSDPTGLHVQLKLTQKERWLPYGPGN